eukprot:TRINITY_DN19584_c0_g1_i1.p1 TRINITY_DN19584_c0_g1~~TRINITY_DN19584_c0_g1_i1.p1  ORF type:complete len:396 (-),score=30.47 TRINITY_DN19584_c0_g1_i1:367-1554(-)
MQQQQPLNQTIQPENQALVSQTSKVFPVQQSQIQFQAQPSQQVQPLIQMQPQMQFQQQPQQYVQQLPGQQPMIIYQQAPMMQTQPQLVQQQGYPQYQQQYSLNYAQVYPQPMVQSQQIMPSSILPQQISPNLNQITDPQPGLNILANYSSVYIKQKLEIWEILCGCETQNSYGIFSGDCNGQKTYTQIFKAKERSECCQRMILPGHCRSFNMNISSKIPVNRHDLTDFEKFIFLRMKRPYRCTYLCFERPIMEVSTVEQGVEKYIGKIINPFSCCDLILEIYNKDNNLDYTVKGDICQLGIQCRGFPCEACQEVRLDVLDKDNHVLKPLTKRSPGCLKAMISDVDEFSVVFPDGASVYQKSLLISATLFMDYLFFEDNQQQSQSQLGKRGNCCQQ